MSEKHHLDTLSLISIQHELAMNIGLNPELAPMVRRIMKICLRRLSVRRVYLFLPTTDIDCLPDGAAAGPEGSFYFSMPADNRNEILETAKIGGWLKAFYQNEITDREISQINQGELFFHLYPLAGQGVLILERAHEPMPHLLIGALRPVFERLRKGCEAALEHERIIREIEGRRAAEKRIKHLAYHDDLTNLPNRRFLLQKIHEVLATSGATTSFHALLYFGLDHFSDINESLGYQIGDAVLVEVAQHIDVPQHPSSIVARLDGDEFGVLLTDVASNKEQARENSVCWAREVLARTAEPSQISDRLIGMSVSAGIVVFKAYDSEAEALFSFGRSALRQAKILGRNTIHVHDATLADEVEQRLNLDHEMRHALKHDEFQLWLQPQVDHQGNIIGAETLIRWLHPDKGLLRPASFIATAEKSGLINQMSEWVLNRACQMISDLEACRFFSADRNLSVNLSAKEFHQPDFVNRVLTLLDQYKVMPERLELELTEGTLLENAEDAVEKMKQLKEVGVRFAIDDFGTGYSSLAYLRQLPIDRMKIDRTFIHRIENSCDDQAIVEVIISLARHFGMQVTAEGIEEREALAILEKMGCRQFQGYLFHRPMPYREFLELLAV
jgi:diguanylate cyclase (GGDEF)-like protein